MINNFWTWMTSSVQNAVNLLQTMYNNTTLRPFFDLLLVVLGLGVIIKFILAPLLGIGIIGGSDKAEDQYNKKIAEQERETPKDAWYRKVN